MSSWHLCWSIQTKKNRIPSRNLLCISLHSAGSSNHFSCGGRPFSLLRTSIFILPTISLLRIHTLSMLKTILKGVGVKGIRTWSIHIWREVSCTRWRTRPSASYRSRSSSAASPHDRKCSELESRRQRCPRCCPPACWRRPRPGCSLWQNTSPAEKQRPQLC